MTQTTYPNGQVLTSSALTIPQIQAIFQAVTCTMLGIDASTPQSNYGVRTAWQTQGAPAWTITDDIVFIECTEDDGEYNKIRDSLLTTNDNVSVTKNFEYTRIWRVMFVARGPNSFDNVRLIKSSLLLDFINDTLAASNLYLVTALGNGIRVPELVEGQWWERVDLAIQFYEQVNESIVIPSVASVEISTSDKNGVQSDIVVTA